MAQRGIINRLLEDGEHYHPEGGVLLKGRVVYRYTGYTYGAMDPGSEAVSDEPDKTPAYQVPPDAVTWDEV